MSHNLHGQIALITGANGFIGSHLTARLLQKGVKVHAITRPGAALDRFEKLGIAPQIHQFDLTDLKKLSQTVKEVHPEFVFNLAINRQQTDWESMLKTNIVSPMTLLNACRHSTFRKFISIGSSLEENDLSPKEMSTPYGANRTAGALLLKQQALEHNIPLAYLCTDYVYGPLQNQDKFIPTALDAAFNDKLLYLSPATSRRDYVHVSDIVDACCNAAVTDGHDLVTRKIVSGAQYSAQEVIALLSALMEKQIRTKMTDKLKRAWDKQNSTSPQSQPQSQLQWKAKIDLATGLRKLIEEESKIHAQ